MAREFIRVDRLEVAVPGGVADHGDDHDQSDESRDEAEQQPHNDDREPEQHRQPVAQYGIHRSDDRGNAVDIAVHDHW